MVWHIKQSSNRLFMQSGRRMTSWNWFTIGSGNDLSHYWCPAITGIDRAGLKTSENYRLQNGNHFFQASVCWGYILNEMPQYLLNWCIDIIFLSLVWCAYWSSNAVRLHQQLPLMLSILKLLRDFAKPCRPLSMTSSAWKRDSNLGW